jgi:hypothetical protein
MSYEEKQWEDQPDHVLSTPRLALVYVGDGFSAEIRHGPAGTYLTVGNLFGSQTVKPPDLVEAVRLLGRVDPDDVVKVPQAWLIDGGGVELIKPEPEPNTFEEEEIY